MGHDGTMAFQGETKLCIADNSPATKGYAGGLFQGERRKSEERRRGCAFSNRLRYTTAYAARMRRSRGMAAEANAVSPDPLRQVVARVVRSGRKNKIK